MHCAAHCEYVWPLPCVTRESLWLASKGGAHGDWKEGLNMTSGLSGCLHMWSKANYTVKGITSKYIGSRPEVAFFLNSAKWQWKLFSHVWLFTTPWSGACRASLSMRFPRREYWSGLPFPSPGDGTRVSCIAGRFFTIWATAFNSTYVFVFL